LLVVPGERDQVLALPEAEEEEREMQIMEEMGVRQVQELEVL
jgi:hypothetical protein